MISITWNDNRVDILQSCEAISSKKACLWQLPFNTHCPFGSHTCTSNEQVLTMMSKSCTINLQEQIKMEFDLLHLSYKGAVTYTYYLLQCLFSQSRDTTAALKKYLGLFVTKCLQRKCVKGEKVLQLKKQLLSHLDLPNNF